MTKFLNQYSQQFLLIALVSLVFLGCKNSTEQPKEEPAKKPNILFIAIDDLRPELGAYGSEIAITPNMDALAADGLLFNNAYCQEAICSPSRASIMTGARPETINVIENFTYFRDENPDIVTLPQHLWANGYETVYTGKIFHPGYTDEEKSWSRKPYSGPDVSPIPKRIRGYVLEENQEMFKKNREEVIAKYGKNAPRNGLGKGPSYEFADAPDHTYDDGHSTDLAIATMKEMAGEDKPFFLGLGFKKPHLEWIAPKKYWDMYEGVDMQMTDLDQGPKDGAAMGLHASFELRARADIPNYGNIPAEQAKNLKRAYLATVSYVDAQIGKMLKALEAEGLKENTIVMLWSDHGWHLGDMGIWGKATNYEIATRVPLIVSPPNMPKEVRGKKTDALVELVDMYPTLCDMVGIPIPEHTEGQSFKPLLSNPEQAWKTAAFMQFPNPALREWAANPLSPGMRETYFGKLLKDVEARIKVQQGDTWDRDLFENRLMGYSMRTADHRFTVWKDYTNPEAAPIFFELYDHKTDPNETVNIANDQPELVASLLEQFNKGWEGNLAK
ncbi:sulfatase [Maribacter algarum]|uniref:Sulfatase n=1 Tax=Maribacter algarum (ex Zhang et al. 2020) TaxID=2578118 RepID=A0A5S3PQ27_9FLAO|nr:sulfatase [Maribacter algarum]TMM55765.1 sulfatase [Maribacter algarum]